MMNIEQRTVSGPPPNEDHVWTDTGAAIVLDGATGLTDATYTDAESDGRWYVETLSREIQQRIRDGKSLTEIVEASIVAVSERFEELTGAEKLEKHEKPSGAGAIVRWQGETLEYFILGDCSVVLETADGTIPVLGKGPRDLDNRVVDRIEAIRAESTEPVSYNEVRERVDDMLIKHRRMMNEQDGYWTLGQTPEAVQYAQTDEIPKEKVEQLIAFTDGFELLVPTYDVFVDWEGLVQYISHNGLDRAIKTLRAFEQADPECRAYPRLKPSDDIGVVHVEFDG
ncbi:protein phosphatase 2C domain-containing protein [Halomicroarcula sp. GCM10025817]|uniref:protein phosphatase 2C domain-containing protein n=1 Tax=Haloarcula TaxID=2237 RepID=UPI0023E8F70A|nr:protein phosphatase 2C domain-containing protein [Halomicroarcula sp. SYNS111]